MRPLISVITAVGPRHTKHVHQARASVEWQTIPPEWVEHIVEYDTDRSGPAKTRNRAIARARGVFIVPLDADDYLIPQALETYLRHYAENNCGYVYGDNYVITPEGLVAYSSSQEYDQKHLATYNIHVVTALIPADAVRKVGGFDERIDAWEDWTLYLRLAIAGICGQRMPSPALVYRTGEGSRMRHYLADPPSNVERMAKVTALYQNSQGVIAMGCCGGGSPRARQAAQTAVSQLAQPSAESAVRMQYIGNQVGGSSLRSPYTRQVYKGGKGRLVDVAPEHAALDVPWLEGRRSGGQAEWRRVQPVAPFVPPPILADLSMDTIVSDLTPDAIVVNA